MSGDSVRAVRNNNPGNLDRGKSKWQGLASHEEMTTEQRAEKRFCVFKDARWGFRAMAVLLINYQDKYNLHTVSGIVNRWAPPVENNTVAYVEHVCELTDFGAAEFLDLHRYSYLAPIVKAIAVHECGGWFFKDADLRAGLRMAGAEPPTPSPKDDRIVQASTVGAPVIGTGIIAELFDTDHTDIMDIYHQVSFYWPKIALLIAGCVVGYCLWRHLRNCKRGAL